MAQRSLLDIFRSHPRHYDDHSTLVQHKCIDLSFHRPGSSSAFVTCDRLDRNLGTRQILYQYQPFYLGQSSRSTFSHFSLYCGHSVSVSNHVWTIFHSRVALLLLFVSFYYPSLNSLSNFNSVRGLGKKNKIKIQQALK